MIFDIDGTLVDTNYLHAIAWRRAFVDCGEEVGTARIHRMIGAGSDVLLRELVGDVRDDIKKAWRGHFDELKSEIRPFTDAAALLRAVKERGATVVLASSSEKEDVDALVGAIDADDAIEEVTSSGDVSDAKPSPDVFQVAMEKAGLDPDATVAVGDTVWDVEAAGRAGLRCVCVLSGGIGQSELEEAGALAVYPDVSAILRDLDRSALVKGGGGQGE
ncbi:MAG: HAD family hydrolase [Acidimicrobiia bacterium]|nr:HAD family hydrolase [Acidimicrobiia bacterium]